MNNLLSYCGLVDARTSASEKDLPVHPMMLIFFCQIASATLVQTHYNFYFDMAMHGRNKVFLVNSTADLLITISFVSGFR
jgi:hypothetical protein